MLEAVLDRLTSDTVLTGLLNASQGDTHIYPFADPSVFPALTYTAYPFSRDGVNLDRLEMRSIDKTFAGARNIMERVIQLLNIEEQQHGWYHNGVNVLSSTLNGGGALEFEGADVFEQYANFDVKWRD